MSGGLKVALARNPGLEKKKRGGKMGIDIGKERGDRDRDAEQDRTGRAGRGESVRSLNLHPTFSMKSTP